MKTFLTILFIGVISVKGQQKDTLWVTTSTFKVINWDSVKYPHYELQPKYDTIKVKILYEQGESIVPMILKAWQVRQFNKWVPGDLWLRDSYGYQDQPDKWDPLQIFLFDDKKTLMDTSRIWNVKKCSW